MRDDELVLRPAVDADAPAVAAIWARGWRDGHLGHVPDELVAARPAGSFAGRVAARVADTTVALAGGAVAGFTMIDGDEVEQVYVAAAHRGKGIAAALLADAEGRIRAAGQRRAWLAVVAGNTRARRFYERSGWRDMGPFDYRAAGADGAAGAVVVRAHRYEKQLG